MHLRPSLNAAALLLAVAPPATAQEPPSIRTAVIGNTAELVDPGELELTLGAEFENDHGRHNTELYVEFEYGVNERLEVGLRVPYLFIDPNEPGERRVDGIGDVEVSAAVLMINEPFLLTAALTISLPTGNDERSEHLGEGAPILEPSLAMELPVGDFVGIFEVGGDFTRGSRAFTWSAAVAREWGETVLSLGVEGSLDDEHSTELTLVPGIGWELIPDVDIAVEGRIGLTHDSPDWGIAVELIYGF